MNLTEVLKRLEPCDTNKPYIFVSYSSNDRALVWPDVLRFQQLGYNVWIDEKNLDKTKASWKEDALKAIEDIYCELVVFYVSKTSLISKACYNELSCTTGEKAVANHMDPVKFIAIDAEEVGNIGSFTRNLHQSVRMNPELSKEEKEEKFDVLYHFMKEFFDSNNEKVRIHPKDEPNRKMNYYEEIVASFPDITKTGVPGKNHIQVARKKETTKTGDNKQPVKKAEITLEDKAVKWYKFANELDVKRRHKEALEYYLKAAEQGHKQAQSMVAYYYYRGLVVQDYNKAFYWYQKSAVQGEPSAQNGLGCCYYNGYGIEKDRTLAFYWFEKAANQNVTVSMYMLGCCYYYGHGVNKDNELALVWLKKAKKEGYEEADRLIHILEGAKQ